MPMVRTFANLAAILPLVETLRQMKVLEGFHLLLTHYECHLVMPLVYLQFDQNHPLSALLPLDFNFQQRWPYP